MSENLPGEPVAESKRLAIAALMTGLGGLVFVSVFVLADVAPFVLYVGLLLGVVGVILGVLALRKQQSKGMALAGLVTGSISVLIAIGLVVFALVFLGVFMPESPYY